MHPQNLSLSKDQTQPNLWRSVLFILTDLGMFDNHKQNKRQIRLAKTKQLRVSAEKCRKQLVARLVFRKHSHTHLRTNTRAHIAVSFSPFLHSNRTPPSLPPSHSLTHSLTLQKNNVLTRSRQIIK